LTSDSFRPAYQTWSTVGGLIATLRKRWDKGQWLSRYAAGDPWDPLVLPVRGPNAAELLDHFDEARSWSAAFGRDARTGGGSERFSIDYRIVQGRNVGANRIPAGIRIASFEQLCALLGTTRDVRALDLILKETRARVPVVLPWVIAHPIAALCHQADWAGLLSTVKWMTVHDTSGFYLRQMDVEGVDTKFVERHRKLLDELLIAALPPHRVDLLAPRNDFARRFGFLGKPSYTRFRLLDAETTGFPPGVTELTLRTDQLAELAPKVATVFVVENEVTYLAFPEVADALVVFGSGFASGALYELPWARDREIVYWGDIDTHGFDILSRLRSRLPDLRSILMDADTLLAHSKQWVTEPSPTNRTLPHLGPVEASAYQDLVEDRYGPRIRLEQERVRFTFLHEALRPWTSRDATTGRLPSL